MELIYGWTDFPCIVQSLKLIKTIFCYGQVTPLMIMGLDWSFNKLQPVISKTPQYLIH